MGSVDRFLEKQIDRGPLPMAVVLDEWWKSGGPFGDEYDQLTKLLLVFGARALLQVRRTQVGLLLRFTNVEFGGRFTFGRIHMTAADASALGPPSDSTLPLKPIGRRGRVINYPRDRKRSA